MRSSVCGAALLMLPLSRLPTQVIGVRCMCCPTIGTCGCHCRDTGLHQCQDGTGSKGVAAASENMLCMEYAMATVRLVNGIADSAQKGKVATSVASLASFAGKLTI